MKNRQRKIAALERRRDVLVKRLAAWERGDPDRTKAEAAALNWAIAIIKNADAQGVLAELEGGHS